MSKGKRIDPLIAKAIKKKDYSIDRAKNYVGEYKIHSIHGKGKSRITIVDRHIADSKKHSDWVNKYNAHVYTEQPVNLDHAIGQARVMKKNVVYIKHGLSVESSEQVTTKDV